MCQNRMHRVEFEIVEQAAEAFRRSAKVYVVPKARQGACRAYPRLPGVDFPRVDVEDKLLLLPVHPAQRPACEAVRKQPEVSPTCDRDLDPAVTQYRNRELYQPTAAWRGQDMRPGLGVRNPVTVVAHREYARIVTEAFLAEDVERPQRPASDRVGGGAITYHGFLAKVLEQRLGVMRLSPELLGCLCIDQPVAHAVRGDFMTGCGNLVHDLRVLARDPAENKEGRPNLALRKHLQKSRRARANSSANSLPSASVYHLCETLDLEVVLHVDGEGISHRMTPPRFRNQARPERRSPAPGSLARLLGPLSMVLFPVKRNFRKKPLKFIIVAYFFPPLSQVGYRRPLRLAEYLRSRGHEVTVFGAHPKTPGLQNYSGVDLALNKKIPPGVRVIRTPSVHGFKILLAFRDRLRRKPIQPPPPTTASAPQARSLQEPLPSRPNPRKGWLSRWVDRVMDWFLVPDHYTGWILTTLPLILLERVRGKADAIFVTGPPWSGLITASLAGRILGIPVYLDYRDPWTFNPYWKAKHHRVSRFLEKWTLATGEAAIVNTASMEEEFLRQYPPLRGRIFTVYNGYEEETRLEMERLRRGQGSHQAEFVVSHVGVLYRDRMPQELARTFAAVSASWEGRRPIIFKFVGPVMDPTVLQRAFSEVGQTHALRFTGEVDVLTARQGEALADVLLLLYPGSLLQVPAKVFEYAFAGNPILSVADEGSETANLVRRHRLGVLFNGSEPPEAIRLFLQGTEKSPREIIPPSPSFIEEFDGTKLSERILEIMNPKGRLSS